MKVYVLDKVITPDGEGLVTVVNYTTNQCNVSMEPTFEYKTYNFDEVTVIYSPYKEFYKWDNQI